MTVIMNNRLRQIIEYTTGGNQTEFAALMGWSPQYLSRLILGQGGIGIRPVVALLEKFPDINARWLLLGEGAMLTTAVDAAKEHLRQLLTLEQYMPAMTAEEIHQLTVEGRTDFPTETITRWQQQLDKKNNFINDAIKRSSSCSHPTVK